MAIDLQSVLSAPAPQIVTLSHASGSSTCELTAPSDEDAAELYSDVLAVVMSLNLEAGGSEVGDLSNLPHERRTEHLCQVFQVAAKWFSRLAPAQRFPGETDKRKFHESEAVRLLMATGGSMTVYQALLAFCHVDI